MTFDKNMTAEEVMKAWKLLMDEVELNPKDQQKPKSD